MISSLKILVPGLVLTIAVASFAHQAHKHIEVVQVPITNEEKVTLGMEEISSTYIRDIKPIFQKACFDCHSENTRYPWYSKLPFAKLLIESDITEAQKHLDLTSDFPFKGHGSSEDDLEAIKGAVEKGEMPPWRYRLMHSASRLTDDEKAKIFEWIKKSQKNLGVNGENK